MPWRSYTPRNRITSNPSFCLNIIRCYFNLAQSFAIKSCRSSGSSNCGPLEFLIRFLPLLGNLSVLVYSPSRKIKFLKIIISAQILLLGMNCDFCTKLVIKYKSFYSPSSTDPTEFHICIDCLRKWLQDAES